MVQQPRNRFRVASTCSRGQRCWAESDDGCASGSRCSPHFQATNRCGHMLPSAASLCRHRNVIVHGRHVTIRYDDTYHIYRPPRAHHCRVLNVVIARFDHFCPWTGTAIGLRNYRPFVLFLVCCTLSAIHAIAFSALHIVHHLREEGEESEPDPGGIQTDAEAPTEAGGNRTSSSLLEILPTPIMLVVLVGASCSFSLVSVCLVQGSRCVCFSCAVTDVQRHWFAIRCPASIVLKHVFHLDSPCPCSNQLMLAQSGAASRFLYQGGHDCSCGRSCNPQHLPAAPQDIS